MQKSCDPAAVIEVDENATPFEKGERSENATKSFHRRKGMRARESSPINTNRPAANERVKRFLKTSPYIKSSFTSIIGPRTMKASLAVTGNTRKFAAMKASDVLQRESNNASTIMAMVAKR